MDALKSIMSAAEYALFTMLHYDLMVHAGIKISDIGFDRKFITLDKIMDFVRIRLLITLIIAVG
jgi:hypothetical protein